MEKTIGEIIDELSIVNIKMSFWNHSKLELYEKLKGKNFGEVRHITEEEKNEINQQIIELDKKVMTTNERRAALKNALNEIFGQMQEARTYKV